MKKIIYIVILLATSVMWCNMSFSEEWSEGVITKTTETTITVGNKTYNLSSDTVIEDEKGNPLPLDALGQKTCCDHIRFLLRSDGYIKKIIVDTSKMLR